MALVFTIKDIQTNSDYSQTILTAMATDGTITVSATFPVDANISKNLIKTTLTALFQTANTNRQQYDNLKHFIGKQI